MKNKAILIALVCGISLSAAACNTVRGVGQDLESAADTVDDAT